MFKYISKKLKHIFSLVYNNLNLSSHLNPNQNNESNYIT